MDSAQIVRDGTFQGKTLLSIFTKLPRKGVRLGAAGKIYSGQRAGELLDEGCDFVLIARAADFRNPRFQINQRKIIHQTVKITHP